tara:strand:- start:518 stop:721 length:204 start_codon:yes stop_codon:yes gene_type:complete
MTNSKTIQIPCIICKGSGIQEETIKGYRRYKCWRCKGTGKDEKTITITETKTIINEEQKNEQNESND